MFVSNKLKPIFKEASRAWWLLIALFCAGPLPAQQDSVEWFPDFWVRSWKPAYWENMQLSMMNYAPNDSLDTHFVLWSLFPGSPLRDEYDVSENDVVAWSCPECPKKYFDPDAIEGDALLEENIGFPYSRNFTEVIGSLAYRSQYGEDFRLISFSTGADYPGSGRFTYGMLGMAKFQRKKDLWVLRSFNPAVESNGAYMRASAPDTVIQIGKNELYLLHGQYPCGPVQEDYWPCFYYLNFYALINNVIVPVLKLDDTTCHNFGLSKGEGPEWTFRVQFLPDSTGGFPAVLLKRQGRMVFEGGHSKDEFVFNLLPELKEYVAQERSFDFELEQRFSFDGKKYGLKHSAVKTKY